MADIEVPKPGASEIVTRMLHDAMVDHPDVEWLGLVSEDGFAIASEGVGDYDVDGVAAGAVRMMLQVRKLSRSLGQSGTDQMFLEGDDSGICVIDKDPWVMVVVGAPGVPVGLLRYEAREIAEAFPLTKRASLEAAEAGLEPVVNEDGEPEIRWADEPTGQPFEQTVPADAGQDFSDWSAQPPAPGAPGPAFDLPAPSGQSGPGQDHDLRDLAPPTGAPIDLPPPGGPAFDLPPPGPAFQG